MEKTFPNIDWKWNLPQLSHTGGFFERLIRDIKKAFNAALLRRPLTHDELHTLATKTAELMNNRPLQYVQNHPQDDVLCPNHFLVGQATNDIFVVPDHWDLTAQWMEILRLRDEVWDKFISQVIPNLNSVPKWRHLAQEIKEDDLVVVLEKRAPSGLWPIARVVRVMSSPLDNVPRYIELDLGYQSRWNGTERKNKSGTLKKNLKIKSIQHVMPLF